MAAEDYHADFYDPPDPNAEDQSHLTHHPTCPWYHERFNEPCICDEVRKIMTTKCYVSAQDYARYFETANDRRMTMKGTIKRLLPDKRCGFIRGENNVEYFFHQSALKNCG